MTIKKILKTIFFSALTLELAGLLFLAAPQNVQAQAFDTNALDFQPQISIPGSSFQNTATTAVGKYNAASGTMESDILAKYVIAIYNYGLAIVGILGAIMLMAGGLIWLTSGGNTTKIGQAKELMTGSIIGMIILLGAWMILNTINPNLVSLKGIPVTVIAKIANPTPCCNKYLGPKEKIVMTFTDKPDESVCESDSPECTGNQQCLETEIVDKTTKKNLWGCLDPAKIICCQYKSTNPLETEPYSCETRMISGKGFCSNPPNTYAYDTNYPGHVCDPDGGGAYYCYNGGKQCCECRSSEVPFSNVYLSIDCQDDLTARGCDDFCFTGSLGFKRSNSRHPGTTCQKSSGYCLQ